MLCLKTLDEKYNSGKLKVENNTLTLRLLMSYIYGAPSKARNFNVVYIYIYMDLRLATLKAVSFYLLHNVSTLNQCRKFSCVTVLCVKTLPATKVTLITDGI